MLVYRFLDRGTGVVQPSSPSFELVWERAFAYPIHRVWYGDLTHDGLSELVGVSMGGVHVLQV